MINDSNPFLKEEISLNYNAFYTTEYGKACDKIEKETILQSIETLPRGTLLDIGCGTGHWSQFFHELGYTVTGIDISEAMLTQAKARKIKGIKWIQCDALSFRSDQLYDSAAFITSLEFMQNPQSILKNICMSIKKDGYLIIGVLNDNSALGKKRKNENSIYSQARFFSKSSLENMFSVIGKGKIIPCVFFSPEDVIEKRDIDIIERKGREEKTDSGVFFAGIFHLGDIQTYGMKLRVEESDMEKAV